MDAKAKNAILKQQREKQEKPFAATVKEAILLRNKDREFHGLEREFIYQQQSLLDAFNKSRDLKHPRDIGNAREEHLRGFLSKSGYVPFRIGISTTSSRVISPSGHTSKELDIVIHDKINSSLLMTRENAFEAYPIECTHGTIQVKSLLTKSEIVKGLENIASYKSLYADRRTGYRSGFGILFAYDSDMEWPDIVNEIGAFAKDHEKHLWCNVVVVLNRGLIFHGDDRHGAYRFDDMMSLGDLQMHGQPDQYGTCLFTLYTILMELCSLSGAGSAPINSYYRLPLISGPYSYEYVTGPLHEMAVCPLHGKYLKKISEDTLKRIVETVEQSIILESWDVFDMARGVIPPQRTFIKDPVRVYNPETLDFPTIFQAGALNGIQMEMVRIAETTVYLPKYYVDKELIIEPCLECSLLAKAKAKRKAVPKPRKVKGAQVRTSS